MAWLIESKGNAYLSKKGSHLVKNNQTLDIKNNKCVKTTQIVDVTGCTEKQVQQVTKAMDSGKLEISNEIN